MIETHKKIIVDKFGQPTDVIIPWEEYQKIEEILELDLNKEAIEDLKQARKDREDGNEDAYFDLSSI